MNFGILDIIFAVVILVAVIRCVFRGFITEFHSIAALLAGIAGSIFLARPVSRIAEKYLNAGNWSIVIAFIAVFLIIYLIVKISEGIVHRLFERLELERLDKALGFFLGLAEGFIFAVIVVFILKVQPFFQTRELLNESYISRAILFILPRGIEIIHSGELKGV